MYKLLFETKLRQLRTVRLIDECTCDDEGKVELVSLRLLVSCNTIGESGCQTDGPTVSLIDNYFNFIFMCAICFSSFTS